MFVATIVMFVIFHNYGRKWSSGGTDASNTEDGGNVQDIQDVTSLDGNGYDDFEVNEFTSYNSLNGSLLFILRYHYLFIYFVRKYSYSSTNSRITMEYYNVKCCIWYG